MDYKCSVLRLEGASIFVAVWCEMCTEESGEDLPQVLVLIEIDSFLVPGLEE